MNECNTYPVDFEGVGEEEEGNRLDGLPSVTCQKSAIVLYVLSLTARPTVTDRAICGLAFYKFAFRVAYFSIHWLYV